LAQLARLDLLEGDTNGDVETSVAIPGGAVQIYAAEDIDAGEADRRRQEKREQLKGEIKRAQGKLANEQCVSKAPPEVVQAERVEIGEQAVSGQDFAAAVTRAAHAAELVNRTQEEGDTVTQFEALTAAAYHELARRGVEVAVIEAGLGGRYDATNVIPSRVQVLTNVGLEHTRWLGPTIPDHPDEKVAGVRDPAGGGP